MNYLNDNGKFNWTPIKDIVFFSILDLVIPKGENLRQMCTKKREIFGDYVIHFFPK
ncbi:hypothetical protein MPTA7396_4230 [Mycoplasmoides pneumoniae]|nr:hypothetical protein KPI25BX_5940 [Mycoplasmoides pneumoniae]GLL58662.1 hypothetical protein Y1241N_7120 [Mycoplasmoides pneumoniae]GLL60073.1 hypothetical protein Y12382J_6810 [Mycoplasmoides pneumoniae]GLL60694.1 hypothetical protein OA571N_5780 [Mycoplasmoides pneumoniae]GLL61418.1 hypothetical protein OA631U_5830 [Mycoplasmoides pneumoniae]